MFYYKFYFASTHTLVNNGNCSDMEKQATDKQTTCYHCRANCGNNGSENKVHAIKELQQQGKKVMIVGDGLNDAGALKQADIAVDVTDNCNNFTSSGDGIVEAS
jgi:magnesium-transporting ATPase (P-type)